MVEFLQDVWELLVGRIGGPFTFRFFVAPIVASLFAVRAGLRDAKKGRDPYFYVLFSNKTHRKYLLRHGWKEIGRVFIVMTVIDVIYQIIVFPYLLMRGLTTRIGKAIIRRRKQSKLEGQGHGKQER